MGDLQGYTTGSWTYDHYWWEDAEATEARQEVLEHGIRQGVIALPEWFRPYIMNHEGEQLHALDWLDHLAHLAVDEYDLAWHLCDKARDELIHGLSLLAYSAAYPGWQLYDLHYAPDDFDREGYVGIIDDGIGNIVYCPWCGERLPKLVNDE